MSDMKAVALSTELKIERIKIDLVPNTDAADFGAPSFQTAVSLLQSGIYDRAEELFTKCIADEPRDGKAMLGLLCVKLRNHVFFDLLTSTKPIGRTPKMPIAFATELENVLLNTSDDALVSNICAYIIHNGISGEYIDWEKFDTARFERLLGFCPTESVQTEFLKKYISACLEQCAANAENDGYVYICRVFNKLIKYLPADENDYAIKVLQRYLAICHDAAKGANREKVFSLFEEAINYFPLGAWEHIAESVDGFAEALVSCSEFEKAREYANRSLDNNAEFNIRARYVLLLASLKCTDEAELAKSAGFTSELKEYTDLLEACRNDKEKLKKYAMLPEQCKETAEKEARYNEWVKENATKKKSAVLAALLSLIFIPAEFYAVFTVFGAPIDFIITVVLLTAATVISGIAKKPIFNTVLVIADIVLPAAFAFVYQGYSAPWFVEAFGFAIAVVFTFVGNSLIRSGKLRVVDAGYVGEIVLSFFPMLMGIAALYDFTGGTVWRGVLFLVATFISAFFIFGISEDSTNPKAVGIASIIVTAFIMLYCAFIPIFIVSWSTVFGVLFGVISIVVSILAALLLLGTLIDR